MTETEYQEARLALEARVAAELRDPVGTKRAAITAARLENPGMTDEQLENGWAAAQAILG